MAQAAELARRLPRYEELCAFLRRNRGQCYLATGNLDVWIAPLARELGLEGHVFSSVAQVEAGHADVGIAFAASHPVPPVLAQAADLMAWDEPSLLHILESLRC